MGNLGDQLIAGLGQAWATIITFVPKLLGFLVILLIGWLIAKAVSKAVELLLGRLGFGRLAERSGLSTLMARSPIDATGLIVKLVFYFILLIALQLAFSAFGAGNPVSNLLDEVISYLPRVVVAVVLVLIAAAIASAVRDLISGALASRQYGHLLGVISYVFLLALGIIAALNQLGIATTVTEPVLITVLATIGGILIIGVGGGMVRPMQQRWENWLNRAESEVATPTVPNQHSPNQRNEPAHAADGQAREQ